MTDFKDRRFRLLVSLSIGAFVTAYIHSQATRGGEVRPGADFTWHWLAGRAITQGLDPYVVIHAGQPYNLEVPYIYPLTAALICVPFSFFSDTTALTLFVGISSVLMSWGLSRDGYHRFPVFLSVAYIWAAGAGQLSQAVMAACLIPWLGFLATTKPNIGLSAFAFRPSKAFVVGALVFLAVTFTFNPVWVSEWRASLNHKLGGVYLSPLTVFGGPVILLALLRWRLPETRLLIFLALMPQTFAFYDQLLLWLVPKTWKESVTLTGLSWISMVLANLAAKQNAASSFASGTAAFAPMIVALLYLPCVIMVLRRPNESSIESASARLRTP